MRTRWSMSRRALIAGALAAVVTNPRVLTAQTNPCCATCNAEGTVVVANQILAERPGSGGCSFKSWASSTVSVKKENAPPAWFSPSSLHTMFETAKSYWQTATCLTISSGSNINFWFVGSEEAWDAIPGSDPIWVTMVTAAIEDGSGTLTDVQIAVNCGHFTDDDWNDDGEPTSEDLQNSPIDGTAFFVHEIGHGLGLYLAEVGAPEEPREQKYTACTVVVRGYNVFGGPKPLDIKAIECAYECTQSLATASAYLPRKLAGILDECTCDFNPVADVVGFTVDGNGIARWFTTAERDTRGYRIAGRGGGGGTTAVLGVDTPGLGEHTVRLGSAWASSDRYDLVEVDKNGNTRLLASTDDRSDRRRREVSPVAPRVL